MQQIRGTPKQQLGSAPSPSPAGNKKQKTGPGIDKSPDAEEILPSGLLHQQGQNGRASTDHTVPVHSPQSRSAPLASPPNLSNLVLSHTHHPKPLSPEGPTTDAQTAIDFLTGRCVGLVRTCMPIPQPTNGTKTTYTKQNPVAHASSLTTAAAALETMPLRPALERQLASLVEVIEGVVREGSSLSALVMGPRASGKTLLVERAVARVCAVHNENPQGDKAVGVVRLSGLLHLEDRVAFSEAARQLCSEFGQPFSRTATYEENLLFFRNMMRSLHASLKKVIFIIDDFERFAKQRGKQTLLYNLLDELQHSSVQAGVIGVTCAQDIMDLMEKRVKSRFSHRRILVSPPLHFEVPDPKAAPVAASGPRRAAAGSNPEPPVQYQDTPLGVLEDLLCLPSPNECSTQPSQPAPNAELSSHGKVGAGIRVGGARTSAGSAGAGSNVGGGASTSAAAAATARASPSAGVLNAACMAALPVWRDPGFVVKHNQAVSNCLKESHVKAVLYTMFSTSLSPGNLAAIARMTLAEWDRDLQQHLLQQKTKQQRQQGTQQQQPQGQEPLPQASPTRNSGKRQHDQQGTDQGRSQAQGPGECASGRAPLLLQPRHLLAGCQSLRQADSMVSFVCDLSVLQLYLLAGMVRLSAKKHTMYNFEMVWDECKSIQDSSGILGTFQKRAAWRAFEALMTSGLAFYSDQAAEAKGRAMKYAGVVLRLTAGEVEEGLAAHESCPDQLKRFMQMEA